MNGPQQTITTVIFSEEAIGLPLGHMSKEQAQI